MMLLKDILYKTGLKEVHGTTDIPVSEICFDSRKAGPGALFVATRGTLSDGHKFIQDVIEKGCKVIVCEVLPGTKSGDVTYILVNDSAAALSIIASNFYGNPSEKLKLVGVTGTNGKTTITTLLYQLYYKSGNKTGLLSTVKNKINDTTIPATHTTPDPVQLNSLLAQM